MTQVSYEKFLPEVMPYVRDCPELAAINAIRNACIEFCKLSYYLRHDADPEDVTAGEGEYGIAVPSGYAVAAVLAARCYGRDLAPISADRAAYVYGKVWRTYNVGSPAAFVQTHPESIALVPVPHLTEAAALEVTVALRPLRTSTQIDEVIFDRWAEAIGFGARARLHDTPGQPYADEEAARRFRTWFKASCAAARIDMNKSLGVASARVRPVPFI